MSTVTATLVTTKILLMARFIYAKYTKSAERTNLIVPHKPRRPYEPSTVFYAQVAGHTNIKGTDILDGPWIVDKSQLHGTEDEVFVARTNAATESEERFLIKNAPV